MNGQVRQCLERPDRGSRLPGRKARWQEGGDRMAIYRAGDKAKLNIGAAKIKKMYRGDVKVYSAGNICTYHVDTGITYQEEVDEGASCLSPGTFTPAKAGWEFVGWREDQTAGSSVLTGKLMGDDPVTLYAVFQKVVTLSYNGNGATSGSTAAQAGIRYYNNGNVLNPGFTVMANGFAKSGYIFTGWMSGSTAYTAGQSVTLSSSLVLTAQWYTAAATTFAYTGGIQTYTVPVTGLYLLKAYGAQGGSIGNTGAVGGAGGHSSKYVYLLEGNTLYVVCGGQGLYTSEGQGTPGGYNGGGNISHHYYKGASGGGCTHIATRSGTLQALGSTNDLIIVAGGGGGAASSQRGGSGGGLTGGNGIRTVNDSASVAGSGGTQSNGGTGVTGTTDSGIFGKGGSGGAKSGYYGGAGGGGLFGGGGGDHNASGGGGSGYIGSSSTVYKGIAYTNSTVQGGNTGNGWASIQLISI